MNSNSIVTQRFIKCHNKLRENKTVKSSRQFAMELEYLPQSLSEILKGRRDVTIELIRKAVEVYRMNPIYIFTGEGSLFLQDEDIKSLHVLTVVTDISDEERIVYVPIPAQAGYVSELNDSTFIKNLPSFTLPDYKYKVGTHRCFDVAGDAMEPTLFEGDKIVCSYIEPQLWETAIKDNYIYILVTHDDILVRRCYNFIKTNKSIDVKSDNSQYEPYPIPSVISEKFGMSGVKISPFLPSPTRINNLFLDELTSLKETLRAQSKQMGELNQTIERIANRV